MKNEELLSFTASNNTCMTNYARLFPAKLTYPVCVSSLFSSSNPISIHLTDTSHAQEEKYSFFCLNISNFHGLLASVAFGACAHPKFFLKKVKIVCILNSKP